MALPTTRINAPAKWLPVHRRYAPSQVVQSLTEVQTSCGVAGVRDLRGGLLIGEGSIHLCDAECRSAMATLALHATECSAGELNTNIGASKADLRQSVLAQASCFPPSRTCFRVMRDLIRFESTRTGQACLADIEQFTNGALADSVAQQQVSDALYSALSSFLRGI